MQEKRIDDLAANGDPVGFAQHLRIQLQLFSIALQKNSAIGNPVGLKVHQRPSIGFLKDQVSNTLYGDPMLSDVRQHRLQLFGTQLRLKGKLAAHPGAFFNPLKQLRAVIGTDRFPVQAIRLLCGEVTPLHQPCNLFFQLPLCLCVVGTTDEGVHRCSLLRTAQLLLFL